MRKFLLLLSFCLLCSLAQTRADECCETGANVEQKLRDIDLGIALKKYEQIQTERARAEVQSIMIETDPDLSEGDRAQRYEQLQRRIQIFTAHADQIRQEILKLSKPVSVAAN
jgi:hypothetical protein